MATTKKRGRGQPTKYRAEFAEQAEKLCKLGMTDDELGMFFEVDERTINNWKHAYREFCHALKRGKLIADANVADRLYIPTPEIGFVWQKGIAPLDQTLLREISQLISKKPE